MEVKVKRQLGLGFLFVLVFRTYVGETVSRMSDEITTTAMSELFFARHEWRVANEGGGGEGGG